MDNNNATTTHPCHNTYPDKGDGGGGDKVRMAYHKEQPWDRDLYDLWRECYEKIWQNFMAMSIPVGLW